MTLQDLHYVCAWTESMGMCGCDHFHPTVASAMACPCFSRQAGSYVVAVENGKYRALKPDDKLQVITNNNQARQNTSCARQNNNQAECKLELRFRGRTYTTEWRISWPLSYGSIEVFAGLVAEALASWSCSVLAREVRGRKEAPPPTPRWRRWLRLLKSGWTLN